MILTDQIMNDLNLSSKFKKNWLHILNFNIYIRHGTQGQTGKWLDIDNLLEIYDNYNFLLNDSTNYSNKLHPWIDDFRKQVNEWKYDCSKLIETYSQYLSNA